MDRPAGETARDWPAQVADTIESVVGAVRDRTAVPLETAARGLVYGIVGGVVGTAALVLLTIALIRILAIWLPVWGAYAALGGLFSGAGLFLWTKRRPRSAGNG